MAHSQGHSVDEYLETIYFLAFPIGEYRPATGSTAVAARVAEMLGVSRASAGEMLKRLEARGLAHPGGQKGGGLTGPGDRRCQSVGPKDPVTQRLLPPLHGVTDA